MKTEDLIAVFALITHLIIGLWLGVEGEERKWHIDHLGYALLVGESIFLFMLCIFSCSPRGCNTFFVFITITAAFALIIVSREMNLAAVHIELRTFIHAVILAGGGWATLALRDDIARIQQPHRERRAHHGH